MFEVNADFYWFACDCPIDNAWIYIHDDPVVYGDSFAYFTFSTSVSSPPVAVSYESTVGVVGYDYAFTIVPDDTIGNIQEV